MTLNDWDRRPRQLTGDPSFEALFCNVGAALTAWETAEGEIATAYVAIIDHTKDGKTYWEDPYFRCGNFDGRHALIIKAITANVLGKDCNGFRDLVDRIKRFAPRRHEIAHGRVMNLGSYGFYLGPNNTLARNYPDGRAVYQYTSADINFYAEKFAVVAHDAQVLRERITKPLQ